MGGGEIGRVQLPFGDGQPFAGLENLIPPLHDMFPAFPQET
jgi:hypothetical protein